MKLLRDGQKELGNKVSVQFLYMILLFISILASNLFTYFTTPLNSGLRLLNVFQVEMRAQ